MYYFILIYLCFPSIYHSYVEWEKYPDRCKQATEILTTYKDKFTPIPEFQVENQNYKLY